jgi:hypothetical protein
MGKKGVNWAFYHKNVGEISNLADVKCSNTEGV